MVPPLRSERALVGDPGTGADTVVAGKLRILVVDDHHDAADMLALMLRLDGHATFTAYNGLEAVERAEADRPDLVLLDVSLPGLDGYEAAHRIRSQDGGAAVRLVAITGWDADENKDRAHEAGFDELLTKPVSPEQLAAVVRSVGIVE